MSSSDYTSVRLSKALIGAGCTGPTGPVGPAFSAHITTAIYVDFLRPDSYIATGSRTYPFKTLALAYALAYSTATDSNPKIIVLLSGNLIPENVTFSRGRIYLIGENSSGTHAPIVFTGALTFTGANTSITSNHFSITGLALVGVSGTDVITFSGAYPQRLFLKDVWVTANGTSHGVIMTNTGTGSTLHANDCKFSHNGSGHYHCLEITAGTAYVDTSESLVTTVGVIGVTTGSCFVSGCELESMGDYAIDVYQDGICSIANSKITTTTAGSNGIMFSHTRARVTVSNVSFVIPLAGGGKVMNGVASATDYGLFYGPMYFLPNPDGSTNNVISSNIPYTAIVNAPTYA
jgi:hypothetical protein